MKNIKLSLLALAIVGIALILPSVTTRAIEGQEVQNTEMSEQQKKELSRRKKMPSDKPSKKEKILNSRLKLKEKLLRIGPKNFYRKKRLL